MKTPPNYYQLLKVAKTATVSEIVAAYHAAKNAFSKDSLANYSLFNQEEARAILDELEEAFRTLTSQEKRRDYDHLLSHKQSEIAHAPVQQPVQAQVTAKEPQLPLAPISDSDTQPHLEVRLTDTVDGGQLAELRGKRGLTLEEVARITKIPTRYLTAIETNDLSKLPARVYVQGFVKNLASLYKLDPTKVAKHYLENVDKLRAAK